MANPAPIEHSAKNWAHFLELISQFTPSLPPGVSYLFRGQADEGWSLTPSLLRTRGIDVNLEPRDLLRTEEVALQEFECQAHLYVSSAVLAKDDTVIDKWQVMQHYGAPTRLLDWTRSAYVATYFAAESQHERPGAVWVVGVPAVEALLKAKYPDYWERSLPEAHEGSFQCADAKPLLYFMGPRFQTDRMGAQQTAFSICTQVRAEHADVIADLCGEAGSQSCLVRLVIQGKDMKLEFMRKLREMNITARALFPGIDGLGRSTAELVRLVNHEEGVAKLGFLGGKL